MGSVGGVAGAWMRGLRPRGLRDQARTSRGQSLVEFALVLPLFLLLIFAVVEYSLINSAIGAFNFAAKDGARYGAIVGPTVGNADANILAIVSGHVSGVVAAVPVEADIFEATESGTYPGTGKQNRYSYSGGTWSPIGVAGWPVATRDDRLVSQDYLGIHIIYHYTYVTAFFSSLGATITLTADSVQRIEPQELFHHPAPGAGASVAARAPVDSPLGDGFALLALTPIFLYRPARKAGPWRPRDGLQLTTWPVGFLGKERRA